MGMKSVQAVEKEFGRWEMIISYLESNKRSNVSRMKNLTVVVRILSQLMLLFSLMRGSMKRIFFNEENFIS